MKIHVSSATDSFEKLGHHSESRFFFGSPSSADTGPGPEKEAWPRRSPTLLPVWSRWRDNSPHPCVLSGHQRSMVLRATCLWPSATTSSAYDATLVEEIALTIPWRAMFWLWLPICTHFMASLEGKEYQVLPGGSDKHRRPPAPHQGRGCRLDQSRCKGTQGASWGLT
jgi:hypothetical protein